MTENKGKWASRHRKIEKSGYQAAAKMISFPRRWHGAMISANQETIWGMSVYSGCLAEPGHGGFIVAAPQGRRAVLVGAGSCGAWDARRRQLFCFFFYI